MSQQYLHHLDHKEILADRSYIHPTRQPSLCGPMAEGSGFLPNPAMGRELVAGHVHRDRFGRSPAPAASHRPVGKKRMQHAVSDRSPKRTEAPEIPRLRALEAQAAAIPISSPPLLQLHPEVDHHVLIHTQLGRLLRVHLLRLCPRWLPKLPTHGTGRIIGLDSNQR